MDPVTFRLNAYKLYEYGDTIWMHPKIAPKGIICKKPFNINNPKDYMFPGPITGEILNGGLISLNFHEPIWGIIHSFFEQLSKEWTVSLYNINITL